MRLIQGICPACGQEQLGATPRGTIACCNPSCPRPRVVAQLLEKHETEHIAQIDRGDFTLDHPLVEHVDGSLFACPMQAAIATAEIAPRLTPGRYRVVLDDYTLAFTPLDRTEPS